jgi:HAD superfamily hydrolase (TIGR01509 family)
VIEALLLDAGNTVVFLDMEALAAIAFAHGHHVSSSELLAVEGHAKRSYERVLREGASQDDGWPLYFITLFTAAGATESVARSLIAPIRAAHAELNLWRRVPADLPAALDHARALGLRVGVVSNAEGTIADLLRHVGLGDAFEVVVDSHLEGVRKPDPEIFRRALSRMNVAPERAIYAGDIPGVDVDGALAAGMHAALIDPYDFYPEHTRSPRYPSVAALVAALAKR